VKSGGSRSAAWAGGSTSWLRTISLWPGWLCQRVSRVLRGSPGTFEERCGGWGKEKQRGGRRTGERGGGGVLRRRRRAGSPVASQRHFTLLLRSPASVPHSPRWGVDFGWESPGSSLPESHHRFPRPYLGTFGTFEVTGVFTDVNRPVRLFYGFWECYKCIQIQLVLSKNLPQLSVCSVFFYPRESLGRNPASSLEEGRACLIWESWEINCPTSIGRPRQYSVLSAQRSAPNRLSRHYRTVITF
jgi:hypothetical protein